MDNQTQQSQPAQQTQQIQQYPTIDRLVAAGCYVPFISLLVCIIGTIKKGNIPFVLYHIKNGLALFVLSFVSIFAFVVPFFGGALWIVFLAAEIYGIVLALGGKMGFIPVVSALSKRVPAEKIYTVLTGKPFSAAGTTQTPPTQEKPPSPPAQQIPPAQTPPAQPPSQQTPPSPSSNQ
ncbi:hypothetical protein HZA39_02300 [Candidatus Peregrinibacteria bacterium]|nr:hypothetical protein [Candidatus Peregrinibacteria bacterium]